MCVDRQEQVNPASCVSRLGLTRFLVFGVGGVFGGGAFWFFVDTSSSSLRDSAFGSAHVGRGVCRFS